uniref:Uncharacterized protein n=1 Tax=Amorphochlora amoebiformis TaxID=1561963 RepID=A0A0H5BR02_9EUKA|nr:hypothetical protein [Amorphochlora amoebiformis]
MYIISLIYSKFSCQKTKNRFILNSYLLKELINSLYYKINISSIGNQYFNIYYSNITNQIITKLLIYKKSDINLTRMKILYPFLSLSYSLFTMTKRKSDNRYFDRIFKAILVNYYK